MTGPTETSLADLIAMHGTAHPALASHFDYLLHDDKGYFFRKLGDNTIEGDLCLSHAPGDVSALVGFYSEGDLTVQGSIYNDDTDSAYSLVVLGHLQARNVLVGGQSLFVAKNAVVSEFFGGDYNHGDAEILGDLHAPVIVTHDYKLIVLGQVHGVHAEDDAGALVTMMDGQASYAYGDVPVQSLLCEDAVEAEGAEPEFKFYGAVEVLKEGRSLLRPGLDLSEKGIAALKSQLAPLLEGLAHYASDDFEEALVSFAQARSVGNGSARLDFHEAAAFYMKSSAFEGDEIARMRSGLEHAIQADYQTNESRLYLAYSFTENEPVGVSRARALAQDIIDDDYSDDDEKAQAHDVLGVCLYNEDRHAESVAYFQAAVALASDRENLQSNLGRALYLTDAYEAAIGPTELAVLIGGDTSGVRRFRLAFCCFETGRWADTIRHAVRYCELDKNKKTSKVTVLSMQAMALVELGQVKEARALYVVIARMVKSLDSSNYHADRLKEML